MNAHKNSLSRGGGFTIGTDFLESPLRNKKENSLRGDKFICPIVRLSLSDQVSASKPFSTLSWTLV